jgi:hypothetical protein
MIVFLSCSGRFEEKETYWDNGKIRERWTEKALEEGKSVKHGQYTRWYSNGNKELEGELVDGAMQGFWTKFYSSGQEWIQSNWENGKFQGNISIWTAADNARKDFVLVKSEYQLEGNGTKIQFWNMKVDYNFCETYQVSISEGRYFSKNFDTPERKVVMIIPDAANILEKQWGNFIGKRLSDGSTIIGVISSSSFLAEVFLLPPESRQSQIPLVLILSPEESH